MKAKEIEKLGYPAGPIIPHARAAAGRARVAGLRRGQIKSRLQEVLFMPERFKDDEIFGQLAEAIIEAGHAPATPKAAHGSYDRAEPLDYRVWGSGIDENAQQQMRNACRLPISVKAALMPDAHMGYGLPIGGVLATDHAVIPYAVGVDIACRMMMTVWDIAPERLQGEIDRYKKIIEDNTRFGVGSEWKPRREHPVLDEDWSITPVTAKLRDLAHRQLGTSGSGNHFVEFGEIELLEPIEGAEPGRYVAAMSHSGSRGPGSRVAMHYSKWAMSRHETMPKELRQLAWLELDGPGDEYWQAMELMGRFASANHHVIHRQLVKAVGDKPLFQVENHHNFAWRETHDGRDVVVHRKGATPAGKGVLGVIPGSMASPAYIVEGLGDPASLASASHGAGRVMSRTAAKNTYRWGQVRKYLAEKGVTLLSAGLDEVPMVYKDIDEVMAAQQSLVRPLARFFPRLVKMAPAGEKPED